MNEVAGLEPEERVKERKLRRAAERLATLANLDGFQFLLSELEKKAERNKTALMGMVMAGGEIAAVQRQADYDRGYADGMLYCKAVVDGAVRKLEKLDKGEEPDEPEEDRWSYDTAE